jgi:hypothetical protein
MIRRLTPLLAVVLVPSFSIPGYAKCACLLITIEVEVRGQVKAEQSVMTDVDPPSSWSLQLPGSSPNHFVIQVPFNTYSGRGLFVEDHCNRKPRTITVMLQHWLHTQDWHQLKFPDDFVADREGYYHAREKVVLDADHAGLP